MYENNKLSILDLISQIPFRKNIIQGYLYLYINLKMSVTELDTFIQKFYQLWNAGQTAHLDVDSHAGKAWLGLRVQLGHAPGPLHHQPHPLFVQPQKKTLSPSRERRRARRDAARLNAEEAVDQEPSKETATEKEAIVTNVETADQHQTAEEVEDVVEHAIVDNEVIEKENVSACTLQILMMKSVKMKSTMILLIQEQQ